MQSEHSFNYATLRLDSSKSEVRLLRFPRNGELGQGDEIECRLQTFALQDAPEFAALSYVWGDQSSKTPIRCTAEGDYVSVTKNLHAAFSYLAQSEHSAFLQDGYEWMWADAICRLWPGINQADNEEKASQVRIMRSIYAQAACTYIWLGSADEASLAGLDHLQWMEDFQKASNQSGDFRSLHQLKIFERSEREVPRITQLAQLDEKLLRILRNHWFTRTWIIQELAVSPNPIIVLAPVQRKWDEFAASLESVDANIMAKSAAAQRVSQLNDIRQAVQGGKTITLPSLLEIGLQHVSTDPRDKVYAFLGLCSDAAEIEQDVTPDYEISPEALYFKVAVAYLRNNRRLDILNNPGSSNRIMPLPSWVRDWTHSEENVIPLLTVLPHIDFQGVEYEIASGLHRSTPFLDSPLDPNLNGTLSEEQILRLSGFPLDSIQELGITLKSHKEPSLTIRELASSLMQDPKVWNDWERVCQARSDARYKLTHEPIMEVYARTITAGVISHAKDKDEDIILKEFQRWYDGSRNIFTSSAQYGFSFGSMFRQLRKNYSLMSSDPPAHDDTWMRYTFQRALNFSRGRRLFRTVQGYIGLGPPGSRTDDEVFLLKGCMTPLVLRRAVGADRWELIGECYLHGAMGGELFDENQCYDVLLV